VGRRGQSGAWVFAWSDGWTHDTQSGGFGKTKFYTKAEAPELQSSGQDAAATQKRPAGPGPRIGGVADLAPFAQHQLAREIAAARVAQEAAEAGQTPKAEQVPEAGQ
jgi:hypothetical protein